MDTIIYSTFESSEQLNEFYSAMAKCQGEMGPLIKDNKVSMELKNGQRKQYNYADLGQAYEIIKEVAPKHGICFFQDLQTINGKVFIVTEIGHSSGQYRRIRVEVIVPEFTNYDKQPRQATPQEFGSAVTYQRRYAILGAFGIASVDDDGQEASKAPKQPTPAKPTSPFEKKIEEPKPLVNHAPQTGFLDFKTQGELKTLGFKNGWKVEQMQEAVKAISGATKWGEIPIKHLESLKSEFNKNQLGPAL